MSYATRPKPVGMMVCDLCDEEIPEGHEKQLSGSLIGGYISYTPSPLTEHVWFATWFADRLKNWRHSHARPNADGKKYDFHYRCIERLVREAVEARAESAP